MASPSHKRVFESSSAPSSGKKPTLQFKSHALLDLYNRGSCVREIEAISLHELERKLVHDEGNRNYSHLLSDGKPQFYCYVNFESKAEPSVAFDCRACKSSCALYREFDAMRFLSGTITIADKENIHVSRLAEEGIRFAGLVYKFLGGEKSDSKGARNDGTTHFSAWFFAERNFPTGPDMSIQQLRGWLGNFEGQSALKVNSRIKLGFSPSIASFELADTNVSVIGDIVNYGGKIMTDGCGYIAADLAELLPANANSSVLEEGGSSYPALIIQMRMICHKGLFKGCLLVTNDPQLCQPGCVVFRQSMKKAEGSARFILNPTQTVSMDLLNTFGTPQGRGAGQIYTALNRQIVILLVYRGVPKEFLLRLVEDEIKGLLIDIKNHDVGRRRSYKLVRQNMNRSPSDRFNGENDAKNDDSNGEEWGISMPPALSRGEIYMGNTTTRSTSSSLSRHITAPQQQADSRNAAMSRSNRQAEELQTFLCTGQTLQEPRVRQLISELVVQSLQPIQEKCQIPLRDSVSLVGAFDPTGTIPEGEVFVCINNGTLGGVIKEGWMLVYRSPCLHPGDLCKVMAVSTVKIVSFVSKTRGGVIFFSTKGLRSTADKISGGDFDGDKYNVIYNSEIMKFITKPDYPPYTAGDPCVPFVAANTPVKSPAPTSSFSDTRSVPGVGPSSYSSCRPVSKTRFPAFYTTPSNTSPPASSPSSSSPSTNINEELRLEERRGPFTSPSSFDVRFSRSSGITPSTDGTGIYKQEVRTPVVGMMANMSHSNSNYSNSNNNNDNDNDKDYCRNSNKQDCNNNSNNYSSNNNNDISKYAVVRYSSQSRPSVAVMSPTANNDQKPNSSPNSYSAPSELPVCGTSAPTPSAITRTVSDKPSYSHPDTPRHEDEWGSDIRGSDIFKGLIETAAGSLVGRFSNACMVFQDDRTFGPAGHEALECAKMFTIAMDAHKTGEKVPDKKKLFDNMPPTPFYLKRTGAETTLNEEANKKAIKNSIVLGAIYETVEKYIVQVKKEFSQRCDFSLDTDMRVDDYEGEYLVEWTSHVKKSFERKRKIMDQNAASLAATSSSCNASNKTKKKVVNSVKYSEQSKESFEKVSEDYRSLFEESVRKYFNQKYSNLSGVENYGEIKDLCMLSARRHIASIIYTATYTYAIEMNKNVAFCWDVCGPELHAIKLRKMLLKNGQSDRDVLLNTERIYM